MSGAVSASVTTTVAGECVQLFAERALFWPRTSTVVIADLHLGKADVFRRAGLALPSGGTIHDLARLAELVDTTGATRLMVLGDFVHGPVADAAWLAAWIRWRACHSGLAVMVIAGNHDRSLLADRSHAERLGIELRTGVVMEPPFAFTHDADTVACPSGLLISGHVHPVIRLPRLPRMPAFCLAASKMLLPAFTAFAGGQPIEREAWISVFACAGDTIVPVPQRR